MRACDFNAITIKNGLPQINLDICGGCGGCVSACPKGIISIMEFPFKPTVLCKSKDKGAISRKVCKASCIGCGICAKNCEAGAITVTDFLAEIDPHKCTGCGACISKCPQKCKLLLANTHKKRKKEADLFEKEKTKAGLFKC